MERKFIKDKYKEVIPKLFPRNNKKLFIDTIVKYKKPEEKKLKENLQKYGYLMKIKKNQSN